MFKLSDQNEKGVKLLPTPIIVLLQNRGKFQIKKIATKIHIKAVKFWVLWIFLPWKIVSISWLYSQKKLYITTICVNVCDHVCLSVCLNPIFSRAAWGMETWMVPCGHKLSGVCFNLIRFTKSCQKLSKKPTWYHSSFHTSSGLGGVSGQQTDNKRGHGHLHK